MTTNDSLSLLGLLPGGIPPEGDGSALDPYDSYQILGLYRNEEAPAAPEAGNEGPDSDLPASIFGLSGYADIVIPGGDGYAFSEADSYQILGLYRFDGADTLPVTADPGYRPGFVRIFVDGVDLSDYFVYEGTNITKPISGAQTMKGKTKDFAGVWKLTEGQVIEVLDGTDYIFAGIVIDVDDEWEIGTRPLVSNFVARDFLVFAEDRVVIDERDGDTLRQLLSYLISTYLTPFSLVTLHPFQENGPTMLGQVYDRVYLNDIFDSLVQQTGRVIQADERRRVQMFVPGSIAAPWGVSEVAPNYDTLKGQVQRGKKRNRIHLAFGQGTKDQVVTITGDGTQRVFPLPYNTSQRPTQLFVVGSAPPTYLNVGTYGTDTLFQWTYREADNALVQLTEAPPGTPTTPLAAGAQLQTVDYVAQYPSWVQVETTEAVSNPREAVYEARDIFVIEQAYAAALSLLDSKGKVKSATMTTRRSGLRPGMSFNVNLPTRGYLGDYLIEEVQWNALSPNIWSYSVKLVEGSAYSGSYLDIYKQWSSRSGGSSVEVTGGNTGVSTAAGRLYVTLGGNDARDVSNTVTFVNIPGRRYYTSLVDGSHTIRVEYRLLTAGTAEFQLWNETDGMSAWNPAAVSGSGELVGTATLISGKRYVLRVRPTTLTTRVICEQASLEA